MTYELIKLIEVPSSNSGANLQEIAYVLDKENGRVLKLPIEDYSGGISYPTTTNFVNNLQAVPPFRTSITPEEVDFLPDPKDIQRKQEQPPLNGKRAKSIMPPHLRGVFVEQDSPGAAVEKRVV